MAKRRKGTAEERLKAARLDLDRWIGRVAAGMNKVMKYRAEVKRLEVVVMYVEDGADEATVEKKLNEVIAAQAKTAPRPKRKYQKR